MPSRWRNAAGRENERIGVEVDLVVGGTASRNEERQTELESKTKRRQEAITPAADANGLDDGAITRIRQQSGTEVSWVWLERCRTSHRRDVVSSRVIEKDLRGVGVRSIGRSSCAAVGRRPAQGVPGEVPELAVSPRAWKRFRTGNYDLPSDEQANRNISEQLHRDHIAKQEQTPPGGARAL